MTAAATRYIHRRKFICLHVYERIECASTCTHTLTRTLHSQFHSNVHAQRQNPHRKLMNEGKKSRPTCVVHMLTHIHDGLGAWQAQVIAVGHECDLALLSVAEDDFWVGTSVCMYVRYVISTHACMRFAS
jgi:hypothetical protein